MKIAVFKTGNALGEAAARQGADLIRRTIARNGSAAIILATGASQIDMLDALTQKDVEWDKVTCFHLDEYIGMPETHPASFRKYLKERFADKVSPGKFHFINGEADPGEECMRLNSIIRQHHVDVAFIGIGENGHLAFNDPPADFETEEPYIVVELDEACRKQQLGEGWFGSLKDVPDKAISMSIRQILKSAAIICSVPDRRKAEAVKKTVKGRVSPRLPASILNQHPDVWLGLDRESAALLEEF